MLRVGDVFFENLSAIRNRDKKFFIVVCALDPVRFALINTRNAVQALGNPLLLSSQVQAFAAECEFLLYDSWIDCHELFGGYGVADLEAMIRAGRRRAQLSSSLLSRIATALQQSTTVPERQKRRCLTAIAEELAARDR